MACNAASSAGLTSLPRSCGTRIEKISKVMTIAKTPSLNASIREVGISPTRKRRRDARDEGLSAGLALNGPCDDIFFNMRQGSTNDTLDNIGVPPHLAEKHGPLKRGNTEIRQRIFVPGQ